MKEKKKEDHYQKTQSASSPGVLGEESNRTKNKVIDGSKGSANTTAHEEGLNEEKSDGNNGAFEGLEDPNR